MEQISVGLTQEQLEILGLYQEVGVSKSFILREALDEYLSREAKRLDRKHYKLVKQLKKYNK